MPVQRPSRRLRTLLAALAGSIAVAAATVATASGAPPPFTDVSSPNTKAAGIAAPNRLSPELAANVVAQGSFALENPSGNIAYYGYLSDGPMVPAPGTTTEASKTEPDKNTYLVLDGQHGPDAGYDYGREFLFQGHELNAGYITRINLQADPAHRVTLLASTDRDGKALPVFDGSAWDPFTQTLVFSAENGANGGIWQATPDYPSTVVDISGIVGRAGYEGIQADSAGNLWIVEDTGGKAGSGSLSTAKQPNSFIYRFVPANRRDLSAGGRLQVLQVKGLDHKPIVFGGTAQAQIDADILSTAMADLHTYGNSFDTKWITIHDTATDGTTPYDANALAKAAGGTPLKRPENGQFRPGSDFREFYFTETGDTNASSPANAAHGGWGSVMKIAQRSPSSDTGTLTSAFLGDQAHTGLDNLAFLSRNLLGVVEDAGDGLHSARNALDSAYAIDVSIHGPQTPIRFLAEGRDASATIDSGLSGTAGFQNEGDNELTGLHVSDGDPRVQGLIGTHVPSVFGRSDDRGKYRWRAFVTQQHGDNVTYELTSR